MRGSGSALRLSEGSSPLNSGSEIFGQESLQDDIQSYTYHTAPITRAALLHKQHRPYHYITRAQDPLPGSACQLDKGLRMSQMSEKVGRLAGSSQQRAMRSRMGWSDGSGRGSFWPPQPTAPTTCSTRRPMLSVARTAGAFAGSLRLPELAQQGIQQDRRGRSAAGRLAAHAAPAPTGRRSHLHGVHVAPGLLPRGQLPHDHLHSVCSAHTPAGHSVAYTGAQLQAAHAKDAPWPARPRCTCLGEGSPHKGTPGSAPGSGHGAGAAHAPPWRRRRWRRCSPASAAPPERSTRACPPGCGCSSARRAAPWTAQSRTPARDGLRPRARTCSPGAPHRPPESACLHMEHTAATTGGCSPLRVNICRLPARQAAAGPPTAARQSGRGQGRGAALRGPTLTVKSLSTSRLGDLRSRCTMGGRQLCR